MKKTIFALLLAAAMLLTLAACAAFPAAAPSDGDKPTYTVGICQLAQHEALDAATKGFIDALN